MATLHNMMPSSSFDDLIESLNNTFVSQYSGEADGCIRMVGILFARPELPLVKTSISQNLDYFHHRSGKNIDFFCAGYDIRGNLVRHEIDLPITKVGSSEWSFRNYQFNELRKNFEKISKWKYSGGVDLILTNVRYDSELGSVFEFDSSILCKLDQMIKIKAIVSIENFFESIFQYAEQHTNVDPTWGFSDERGSEIVGSVFKRFIFSLLPKSIGDEVKKACKFAIIDLSRSS